jgi:sialate O-acetylesterase
MYWPLGRCSKANEEAAATANYDIRLWDFNTGIWHKITPKNAKEWSAMGVSFAIRRAQATGKPIAILYVAAGGTPTESFLSEETMAAWDANGKPKYPNLLKIVTNRKQIHENEDFPCKWCAREYPRRKTNKIEAYWWPLNKLYREGIAKVKHLPIDGVLWYQGESNATVNLAPDKPLADDYMLETLLAVIEDLRPNEQTPFLMVGLPVMNRPWEPYRAAQKKACQMTGATYLDTFSAGYGEMNNVHPTNKIPFVEMAAEAAAKLLDK